MELHVSNRSDYCLALDFPKTKSYFNEIQILCHVFRTFFGISRFHVVLTDGYDGTAEVHDIPLHSY